MFKLIAVIAISMSLAIANGDETKKSDVRINTNLIQTAHGASRWVSGVALPAVRCDEASPTPLNSYDGAGLTLRFSFGIVPAEARLGSVPQYIGSWTVRSLVGETVASFFFDGRFTGGTLTTVKGGGTQYELRGVTTMRTSTCRHMGTDADDSVKQVRLYGMCGRDQEMGIQVMSGNRVYAEGFFRGDVTCGPALINTVNTTLDRR